MVAWALKEANKAGIELDAHVLDLSGNYLSNEFNRTGTDTVGRAAVLHALAVLDKASFEQVNSLNRGRQSLNDFALAYLALTFGELNRANLAGEVLDILATRAKSEVVAPGSQPRTYWEGRDGGPWLQGRVDATALVALAFARNRPSSAPFEPAVAWLLGHRAGLGWSSPKAKGAAVAAIAASKGKAGASTDRYRLVVAVNGTEVERLEILGSTTSQTIAVPRKALKASGPNAIRFLIEGRGTYGYAATLTGFARDFSPEQKRDGKPVVVADRSYLPAAPELDGKTLPTGFNSVINPTTFVNKVSEVTRGGRIKVELDLFRESRPGVPQWEREFLIVEETLPAGTTLVEGSVTTTASSYTVGDGVITFAFAPEVYGSQIKYELAGYLPGEYRALPTKLRNAYDPNQVHLGPVGTLKVLGPRRGGDRPLPSHAR